MSAAWGDEDWSDDERSPALANNVDPSTKDDWQVVSSQKQMRKSKPIYFGNGINAYTSFALKHPCKLLISLDADECSFEGTFGSVYHYVQARKVDHFGTVEQMALLLQAKNNREIHELSSNLESFDKAEWYEIELDAIYAGFWAKAQQCPDFRHELLSTGDRPIILRGVKWWGDKKADNSTETNVMGQILQRVRRDLQMVP